MERRGFLKLFGVGVAGLALDQAIPLGRVWSFPKEIRVLGVEELLQELPWRQWRCDIVFVKADLGITGMRWQYDMVFTEPDLRPLLTL